MGLKWIVHLVLSLSVAVAKLQEIPRPTRLAHHIPIQVRQINDASAPDPYPRAKAALSLPEISSEDPVLNEILADIQEGMRYVLQTNNEFTFTIHGTGTTGLAAVLDNVIEGGNRVLVMSIGHWGDVMADMSERLGAEVIHHRRTLGTRYSLQEIETALRIHKPNILTMIMGESDTGVFQPMDGVGDLARRYNALLVVDVVAVAGLQPLEMDKLKIDVVYANSNRGFGGVPGLAAISLSPRAVEKLRNRSTPPRAYQTDLLQQAQTYNITNPVRFNTLSMPLLYSLREGLATLAEERVENTYKRHASATRYLERGLEAMGLEHFVPDPEDRLIAFTTVLPPKGKDLHKIVEFMFKNSNVSISPGYGPTKGKILRIATFASNANLDRVTNILRALKRAILSPETNI